MKKITFLFYILTSTFLASAQTEGKTMIDGMTDPYPPTWVADGVTYYCGYPINDLIRRTGFIFEGKILTDSISATADSYGYVATYHKVLVLKQFKGTFESDTIAVATYAFAQKGDEAVFWADKTADIFIQKFAYGSGFIPVCDKKDIAKEVYVPIQNAVGQPFIEVHPNSCKAQMASPNLK